MSPQPRMELYILLCCHLDVNQCNLLHVFFLKCLSHRPSHLTRSIFTCLRIFIRTIVCCVRQCLPELELTSTLWRPKTCSILGFSPSGTVVQWPQCKSNQRSKTRTMGTNHQNYLFLHNAKQICVFRIPVMKCRQTTGSNGVGTTVPSPAGLLCVCLQEKYRMRKTVENSSTTSRYFHSKIA